jgi:hypothetical protein
VRKNNKLDNVLVPDNDDEKIQIVPPRVGLVDEEVVRVFLRSHLHNYLNCENCVRNASDNLNQHTRAKKNTRECIKNLTNNNIKEQ